MKKALSLILALVMCISLIPLGASASGGASISLEKKQFGRCEPFDVAVTGITAQMEEESFVGIYKKGAEEWETYSDVYVFSGYKYPPAGSSRLTFIAPDEPGEYEVRLYDRTEGEAISTIPFTVSGTAAGYGDKWLQMSRSSFDPNEPIDAMVFGLTMQEAENRAWVGMFKKGASHYDFDDYRFVHGGDSVWGLYAGCKQWFTAPVENGNYELRLFRAGGGMGDVDYDAAFVTSVPFTVGKVAKSGSISLDKKEYKGFEGIIVSISGITDQMVASRANLALCEKGASHENAGPAAFVSQGDSVETRLTAPNKNGEYEIRLYSMEGGNSDETLVMSVPFTVDGETGADWAKEELEKASELGLIPDSLKGQDLEKPITRAVRKTRALCGRRADFRLGERQRLFHVRQWDNPWRRRQQVRAEKYDERRGSAGLRERDAPAGSDHRRAHGRKFEIGKMGKQCGWCSL